jgi:hypothetical protein
MFSGRQCWTLGSVDTDEDRERERYKTIHASYITVLTNDNGGTVVDGMTGLNVQHTHICSSVLC